MYKITPAFFFALLLVAFSTESCKEKNDKKSSALIIGSGQMPDVARDANNSVHIVYGNGDSIMYTESRDQGKTFSAPGLIAVLPELAAANMRGPQIASVAGGVTVIAGNKWGNIYSYHKDLSGKWMQTAKVNDVDSVAKEEFMDVSADGENMFAVWLDLRNKHNQLYGAASSDGGKTWSKNKLVYSSRDTTVCECCKPSVVTRGNKVYVMFRNWLKGNRDLYLIESANAGATFGEAQKLGNESWALNGCPMDGGGLAINNRGTPETIWFRKNMIYTCQPGKPEVSIGQGRNCTIESADGENIFAWVENGDVVIMNLQHEKKILGKGSMPVLKAINKHEVLCVWENESQIYSDVVRV